MNGLIFPFINFIVMVGALAYFTRKPLAEFVYNRHVYLRDEVSRVHEQLTSARQKFDEFSTRLQSIETEVSTLRARAKEDAEAMRLKIVNEAKRLSNQIVSDAQVSSQGVFADLRTQLRSEIGAKILERAEDIIRQRLTGDDRQRLQKEFSSQLESVS